MARSGVGIGATLATLGQDQKRESVDMLGKAADQESERNARNTAAEAQRKAGNRQLGGTIGALGGMALGAEYGSVIGPWGTVIGGAVGALAGGLF